MCRPPALSACPSKPLGPSAVDAKIKRQTARTKNQVPGCMLANNTGELLEGSRRALVGWVPGPFLQSSLRAQGFCPMFCVDLRIGSSQVGIPRKAALAQVRQCSRCCTHEVHTCHPSCPLPRSALRTAPRRLESHKQPTATTATTKTSCSIILPPPPPPLTPLLPSHLPGVARRHCHDCGPTLAWSSILRQLDPHQLYT
jgi:hypothetical protein